jgi:CDP-ribitol ribitolphosphotransferase
MSSIPLPSTYAASGSGLWQKRIASIVRRTFGKQYAVWNSLFRRKHGIVFLRKGTSWQYGNIPYVSNILSSTMQIYILDDEHIAISHALKLARTKVIVQDQSSIMMGNIIKDPATIVVQLWHSGGWYKKVGYDAPRPGYPADAEERRITRLHGNIDYMVISDAKLVPSYASAFHLPEEHVLPLGLPRTDCLLARDRKADRTALDARFPHLAGKRLLLFAPTWRADCQAGVRRQPIGPDLTTLRRELGGQWAFCWRSHPTLGKSSIPSGWLDVSTISQDFCLSVTDVLVTDYSSILFDYALLGRPIYLFTPDRDAYVSCDRDLYLEPEEIAPGAVAHTADELAILVASGLNVSVQLRQRFMSACDGQSVPRVTSFLRGIAQ